jgi:hypothetical protein
MFHLTLFNDALSPEPIGLGLGVLEDDIAAYVALQLPWLHEDDVPFDEPGLAASLRPDTTQTRVAVETGNGHLSVSHALFDDAEDLIVFRHADAGYLLFNAWWLKLLWFPCYAITSVVHSQSVLYKSYGKQFFHPFTTYKGF